MALQIFINAINCFVIKDDTPALEGARGDLLLLTGLSI